MNAIIFHGSAPHATADKFWYKNIAHSLNALGISTIVADLPKLDQESLTDTLVKIREMNLGINQNTILIGHSAGTNIILALLEQLTKPVKAVYCQPNGMRHTTLKKSYDWKTIKKNSNEFYIWQIVKFKWTEKPIKVFNGVTTQSIRKKDLDEHHYFIIPEPCCH